MDNQEINIVIALDENRNEIVGAYSDRETAMNLYQCLIDKGIRASIHAIEINSKKEFWQEFDL